MIDDEQFRQLLRGDNPLADLYKRLSGSLDEVRRELEAVSRTATRFGDLQSAAAETPPKETGVPGRRPRASAAASDGGQSCDCDPQSAESLLGPIHNLLDEFRGGRRGPLGANTPSAAGAGGRTTAGTPVPELAIPDRSAQRDQRREHEEQTKMLEDLLSGQEELKEAVAKNKPPEVVWAP